MQGFHCRTCGEYHPGMPLAFGADEPYAWHATAPEQRSEDDELASDQCVLQGRYYVRGCLDLPIQASTEVFRWRVWVKVSEADFFRMSDLWDTEGREAEPPFEGCLNTSLPLYPETLDLPVRIRTQPVGVRPQVEVADSTHPLHYEQGEGLTWAQVQARVEQLLH